MKLFETFNIEIVNYCQTPFGCDVLLSDLCMNMLNNVSDSLILLHFIVYIMFLFPYWVFFMFLRLLTTIVFYLMCVRRITIKIMDGWMMSCPSVPC